MFKEMRRQDRALTRTEADEILINGTYGVLSMNSEAGHAYGVPLSYVYFENGIYLHCALSGQKLDYIRKEPNVSFCVVGKVNTLPDKFSTQYESVIAFGRATEIDGEAKIKALMAFIHKYSSDFMEKGTQYVEQAHHKTAIIKITIEHLTGKARK